MQDRNLFINGFDGYLRDLYGTVKIVPDLRRSVQACALLTFSDQRHGNSLVLLDKDANIVNAESKFCEVFEDFGCKADNLNLSQISRELVLASNLLKAFPSVEQRLS